jgi:hypothetical protein
MVMVRKVIQMEISMRENGEEVCKMGKGSMSGKMRTITLENGEMGVFGVKALLFGVMGIGMMVIGKMVCLKGMEHSNGLMEVFM